MADYKVDPDCAICHAPPERGCGCESSAMIRAVKEAEARIIRAEYRNVREWARTHAQDYVLEYFRLMSERRKADYRQHVEQLKQNAARFYNARPHPSDMHAAKEELRRGINEDWQSSVRRYPEVLDYFFGLVRVKFPDERDRRVRDPPLSAMSGGAVRRLTFR